MKVIWVPNSETHVTVRDGVVTVAEHMTMAAKPLEPPKTGFNK
jgi:hypothetical protein